MKTTRGALRNMTTGILHTEIGEVYKFIEQYTGQEGIMTHHLPSACRALEPILKSKLEASWFVKVWLKTNLSDEVDVPDMTEDEHKQFWESFDDLNGKLWDSIKHKTIFVKP